MSSIAGLAPGTIVNDVIIGRKDHLFLGGGAHTVKDFVSGRRQVSEASLQTFRVNLLRRAQWCKSLGAGYRHLISPDKHAVLPEEYPLPIATLLGQLYLDRSGGGDSIIYPVDDLRTLGSRAFQRADTHLADKGSVLTACKVAATFTGGVDPSDQRALLALCVAELEVSGDLGSKLTPPVSFPESFIRMTWNPVRYSFDSLTHTGAMDIYLSKNAKHAKQLMIFGDSFGRALARIFSYFFTEVIFMRTQYVYPELIALARPDHVLSQNVERYLADVGSDDLREFFFKWHYTPPDKPLPAITDGFPDVLSAMMSFPRAPYQRAVERHGAPARPARA
jgi:hypothetical protein